MKRAVIGTLYLAGVAAYVAVGWVAGLVLLGVALLGTVRELVTTAHELAPTATCPRGHTFPTYGRVECAECGWVTEGSLWRCANCDARFVTRCPRCGLTTTPAR